MFMKYAYDLRQVPIQGLMANAAFNVKVTVQMQLNLAQSQVTSFGFWHNSK